MDLGYKSQNRKVIAIFRIDSSEVNDKNGVAVFDTLRLTPNLDHFILS